MCVAPCVSWSLLHIRKLFLSKQLNLHHCLPERGHMISEGGPREIGVQSVRSAGGCKRPRDIAQPVLQTVHATCSR